MKEEHYDWPAILKSPNFIKLQRKKNGVLFGLWLFGSSPYLLLIVCAAYAPEILNVRLFGRINVGYLFCMSQFFTMIVISLYYNYRTNKHFDPLTRDLVEEIQMGEAR